MERLGTPNPHSALLANMCTVGHVPGRVAIALDVVAFQQHFGVQAEAILTLHLAGDYQADVYWRPAPGDHIVDAVDQSFAVAIRKSTLNIRLTKAGATVEMDSGRFNVQLATLGETTPSNPPRILERTWGRIISYAPSRLSELRESTSNSIRFENIGHDKEYSASVFSDDNRLYGRTEFVFDGSPISVELRNVPWLTAQLMFPGTDLGQGDRVARVAFDRADPTHELGYGAWNCTESVTLAKDGRFSVPAVSAIPHNSLIAFPVPNDAVVRIEVPGFEPLKQKVTWDGTSLLDLGQIVLHRRTPDLTLTPGEELLDHNWLGIAVGGTPKETLVAESVLSEGRVELLFEKPLDLSPHTRLLLVRKWGEVILGASKAETGVWQTERSEDFTVELMLPTGLRVDERIVVGISWYGIESVLGRYDSSDVGEGPLVKSFAAPSDNVELWRSTHGPDGSVSSRRSIPIRPGVTSVDVR